jgi:hypothetical protein
MSQKNETTKDSMPKTEAASAAPHNTNPFGAFPAFDPMAAWTAAQANWHKLMADSMNRAQAWSDEYAALEAQMYSRALQAVDTWAQLARDTIQYSQQLSQQARKLSVETVRKASAGA